MNQPSLFKGVFPSIRQVKAQAPLTKEQFELAELVYVRAWASRCLHVPPCGSRTVCIRQLALAQREKGYS